MRGIRIGGSGAPDRMRLAPNSEPGSKEAGRPNSLHLPRPRHRRRLCDPAPLPNKRALAPTCTPAAHTALRDATRPGDDGCSRPAVRPPIAWPPSARPSGVKPGRRGRHAAKATASHRVFRPRRNTTTAAIYREASTSSSPSAGTFPKCNRIAFDPDRSNASGRPCVAAPRLAIGGPHSATLGAGPPHARTQGQTMAGATLT